MMTQLIFTNWRTAFTYVAFASVIFGLKLWVIASYANATPFWDQWGAEASALYEPYLENKLYWPSLFSPHNEHRILTTRLLGLALLSINGIWNPLLQMVVNAGLHILALIYLINLSVKVIGRNYLNLLLIFSLLVFGIPYAWENTLAGFQAQFYFVLLFSIICIWYTVTEAPLSGNWWFGIVSGILAFFSLASGLFAFAASGIGGLILYYSGLRKTPAQLIAIAVLISLFLIGFYYTPALAHHDQLKAQSVVAFTRACFKVLGWPLGENLVLAILRNFPSIVFMGLILWKRPPVTDRRWFVLVMVIWGFGQAVSIAYGRAGNLAPRYLDLFAISIFINFVCILSLLHSNVCKFKSLIVYALLIWMAGVLVCLGSRGDFPINLAEKMNSGKAQETNTINYLLTNDFKHLSGKARFDIPYPDPNRLAEILSSPTIRSILPTNLQTSFLPATAFESNPGDVFIANGYAQGSATPHQPVWGSFNTNGNVSTGQLVIHFENANQASHIAVPVMASTKNTVVNMEIAQNGQKTGLDRRIKTGGVWKYVYAKIGNGPFTIYINDLSPASWVAIGAPVKAGALDKVVEELLKNYHVFLLVGIIMGLALATEDCINKNQYLGADFKTS